MFFLALRSPSFLPDSLSTGLFENHWMIWAGMAAIAGLILVVGRARAHRGMFQGGVAGLAVVVAWVLLAVVFDSPGERLHNAHVSLAAAVKEGDVDRVVGYLSPNFTAAKIGITKPAREDVRSLMKETGIKENHITSYNSTMTHGQGLTDITVITETSLGAVKTTWRLSWDDVPGDDWKIVNADLLKLNDQPIPADMQVR